MTGAIKGTPHRTLYEETRWQTTSERRERRNLTNFYKLYHRLTPEYMNPMLPRKVREANHYNLRNKNNLSKEPTRSTLRMNSFVTHMTDKWNKLDDEVKYIGGLHEFTQHLKRNDKKPPEHYLIGDRNTNIHHTRMRMGCSLLSADLFNMKIIDSPKCECGHDQEDASHYLFHCNLYTQQRRLLEDIDVIFKRDANTFLHGDANAPKKKNKELFEKISEYIRETKRFN